MIELVLPYPPSVNHYWRHVRGRVMVSAEGRRYRLAVTMMLRSLRVPRLDGPLEMTLEVHPPDNRRRDLDNILKSLFDSLQYGGAYEDDSQIGYFSVRRLEKMERGAVHVVINPLAA